MVFQLPDPVCYLVDEITVMADYQHRSVKSSQGGFHRLSRHNIKVIRRFVQHQTVCAVQHQLQQYQPGFLPAGQGADLFENIVAVKQHSAQQRAGPLFCKTIFH